MDMRHWIQLIEDAPTDGLLPITKLMSMLPDVTDRAMFSSAIFKVQQGETDLTPAENDQLARAFISLIRMPAQAKMAVVQTMRVVQQATGDRQGPDGA